MPSRCCQSAPAEGGEVDSGGKSVRRPPPSPLDPRSAKDVNFGQFSSSPEGKMEF